MTVLIVISLPKRSFTVEHDKVSRRFGIPEGYDIRVTDLKEIIGTAVSLTGVDPGHWWEFHHDRDAERDKFTTSQFTLRHAGQREIAGCYIEWNCDAEGHERGTGYRGDGDDDRLGGSINDQQMSHLSCDLAFVEERAMEEGYALKDGWLMRVLDDETGALVQARVPASWSQPPRWKAIPLS